MDINELIGKADNILKEIERILLKRPIKKNQFLLLKAKFYELSFSLQELEKVVFALKQKEFNTIIQDSVFALFYKKVDDLFYGIEEKDIMFDQEEYFKMFQEEFSYFSKSIKNTLIILEEKCMVKEEFTPVYTKKYLTKKAKNPYKDYEKRITVVEKKILDYFNDGRAPGGSTIAKRKPPTEHLHAHIPAPLDNHRILYDFYPKEKKIIFLDLGTHKELGITSSEA